MKSALKSFVGNESNLYVQYTGRELTQMKNEDGKQSSEDVVKLTEEIFKMVGKAIYMCNTPAEN